MTLNVSDATVVVSAVLMSSQNESSAAQACAGTVTVWESVSVWNEP